MPAFGAPSETTIAARVASVEQSMPQPASAAPPAVGDSNVKGAAPRYALEDHTHKSSVQAKRMQVVGSAGIATWTFATPYDVAPVVTAIAETPNNSLFINVASVVEGSITTTKCDIVVQRVAKTQTLASSALALLGLILPIFAAAPADTYVNCVARKASA